MNCHELYLIKNGFLFRKLYIGYTAKLDNYHIVKSQNIGYKYEIRKQ
jgi:hypothetical protein